MVHGVNMEEDVGGYMHKRGPLYVLSACSIWRGRGDLSCKLLVAGFCKGKIFCLVFSLYQENPFIFISSSVKMPSEKTDSSG